MKTADVTAYIPKGRENAVTREYLCAVTGLPDRKLREEIERARRRGAIIINNQSGAGYYQSDDLQEIANKHRISERATRPFNPCLSKALAKAAERSRTFRGKEGKDQ